MMWCETVTDIDARLFIHGILSTNFKPSPSRVLLIHTLAKGEEGLSCHLTISGKDKKQKKKFSKQLERSHSYLKLYLCSYCYIFIWLSWDIYKHFWTNLVLWQLKPAISKNHVRYNEISTLPAFQYLRGLL